MNRILILRTGSTAPQVQRFAGDYDRWFVDAMPGHGLGFDVIDVTREAIPSLSDYAGVIVTGATSAAYDPEPWMPRLSEVLRSDGSDGPPMLCVCLGAQLLAQARGGRVILNPNGWEIGGVTMRMTAEAKADPLFAGLPETFSALTTHEDRIEALPPGAVLLAGNACSPVQAFRAGERRWGVQFHPEATPAILGELIRLRAASLEEDAAAHGRQRAGHVDRLLASVGAAETGQGRSVLDSFVRMCSRPLTSRAPA